MPIIIREKIVFIILIENEIWFYHIKKFLSLKIAVQFISLGHSEHQTAAVIHWEGNPIGGWKTQSWECVNTNRKLKEGYRVISIKKTIVET